jgi:outer membrane lipoprotein-sorting protein
MNVSRLFRSRWFSAWPAIVLLGGLGWLTLCLWTTTVAGADAPPAEGRPSAMSALMGALEKALADKVPKLAEGDPEGYALYRQMIGAMRSADSLSYVSHYEIKGKGFALDCTYRAWLKKPNYFRIETESPLRGKGGILIGDGSRLWIHWPQGRPFGDDDSEADKKMRATSYMTKSAPPGGHSIGHETGLLGAGLGMPIIDPSTFHGYTDSLQPYLDGVTSLPAEKVGAEECDHIEVNIMKHQRSWELWLSKADHLPRKLKQTVRVSYDIIMNEEWSEVTINAEMPNSMFAWKPPEGWTEWRMPPIEAGLMKPGTEAPDFELDSADSAAPIKLSNFRGKIVWLYVWRAG